uniref:Uncharacterized protein n=1 Tax=Arundo donax TaxID=35708 RepID=A0A0A9AFV1_ARUDO
MCARPCVAAVRHLCTPRRTAMCPDVEIVECRAVLSRYSSRW